MTKIFYSWAFFLLIATYSFAQSPYKEALQNYRINFLPEKVFVHTDKDIYAAGETIWGSVYLVDGQTHKPNAFSTTVHVELVDEQQSILQSAKVLLLEGQSALSLVLPKQLPIGNYQLRAYTNYQQNSGSATLYRKTIAIVNGIQPLPKDLKPSSSRPTATELTPSYIQLQFFPEGGDCVVGLPCKTALLAQDKTGNPLAVSGQIFDASEKAITFFETNAQGMGQFSYVPQTNQTYQAKVKETATYFPMREALSEGYTLNVYQKGDSVSLLIQTNLPKKLRKAAIVVHHRGLPFIEESVNLADAKTIIPIQKKDLLTGVYVATLFDAKANPVAERLFFIAPQKESTEIDIALSANTISPQQKIGIQLSHKVANDIPNDSLLASKLSLSVVPKIANLESIDDLRTWFLLNSDLDIPIQDAGKMLFTVRASARDYLIEQFLLTRGWRRFRWKEILSPKSSEATYALEQGLTIKGKLTEWKSKNTPQSGKVFLSQMENELHEAAVTDAAGNFAFGPYILYDTSTFILQGRIKKSKKKKPVKNITFEDSPYVDISIPARPKPQLPISPLKKSTSLTTALKKYEDLSQEIATNNRRRKRAFLYNGNPSFRFTIDDNPGAINATSFLDLLVLTPGVNVLGDKIFISGGPASFVASTTPLFILDGGMAIDKSSALSLVVREIEFIDVLRGADASIYGSRGGNGVILIYTRKRFDWESDTGPPPGLKRTTVIGYHLAKEYAIINPRQSNTPYQPDVRSTLHWNPNLYLPNNEVLEETFTTSDKTGQYIIVVQGIRKNGIPLFGSSVFEVN